jgi:hypothetical protein
MKAISAPRTGVDSADRAERDLGPFATLGCPIFLRVLKGAKGHGTKLNQSVGQ